MPAPTNMTMFRPAFISEIVSLVKSSRLLIFAFLMFASPVSWGWNTYGHLLTTDLATSRLTSVEKRNMESIAYSVVRQMDSQQRLRLMRNFKGTSSIAHLSTLPDLWRDKTILEIYSEYGSAVPPSLQGYAETNSKTWHYINQKFSFDRQYESGVSDLDKVDELNVVSVFPLLIQAYAESETKEDKAIALAFILHLVADAHNPLHTMTYINEDLESDRGGNMFCVTYRPSGRNCKQSLHQVWDNAVGFFDKYDRVPDAIDYALRVKVDQEKAEQLDPAVWAEEGFRYAHFVYATKQGEDLDSFYTNEGQIISYDQIALAAERLAAIIKELK